MKKANHPYPTYPHRRGENIEKELEKIFGE